MVELWPHQVEAVEAVRAAWAGGMRRPAVVLPTGSGKTTVFGEVAGVMAGYGVTSLILAHRDELIEQAAERVKRMLPHLRVGIVKGPREEIRGRQVIVGSVGTLGRKGPTGEARRARVLRAMGPGRLIVVDECHHAVADTYMRILRDLGAYDPIPADGSLAGAYALGVTATMTRSDRLALGQVWEDVVYRKSIVEMIRQGRLVNAVGVRVKVAGLDLSRVRRVAGDFNQGELSEALHDALAPKAIARAYVEHAAPRKALVFCPGVAIGYEVAEAFRSEGVSAIAFDGTTDPVERRRILAALRTGEYRVVVNCAVLTEGFDEPTIECVIIARPTSSRGLYVQMAGRGLRVIEGCVCHLGPDRAITCASWRGHKRDCMIMDVVGVTGKHRLAGLVDLGGADRTEDLEEDLKIYDQMVEDDEAIDLLGLLDPSPAERAARVGVDGPLVAERVDLFYESRMTWLQTARGVWFLEGGHDRVIFIAPEATPGRYAVCYTGLRNPSGGYLHRGLGLDEARSKGEHEVGDENGAGWRTRRSAGWRRGEPSKIQIGEAVRLGITVWLDQEGPAGTPVLAMTRGELSDAIAVVKVSRRVDDMAAVRGVTPERYWPEWQPEDMGQ